MPDRLQTAGDKVCNTSSIGGALSNELFYRFPAALFCIVNDAALRVFIKLLNAIL